MREFLDSGKDERRIGVAMETLLGSFLNCLIDGSIDLSFLHREFLGDRVRKEHAELFRSAEASLGV